MGSKVLLPVCDCVYSEQAVKYVARISSAAKDVIYTLFNVQPLLPDIFIERAEIDPDVKAEVNELVQEGSKAAGHTVDRYKDLMVREGIPENRIEAATRPMQFGMAKDILNRAEERRYDAIVLGRRGLTPSKDCLIGATAAKVVEHALKIPVWIVAGETMSMNMIVAVDGFANSFRVVDHLVRMVGRNPDLRLTLFHVPSHLRHCYAAIATGRTYDMAREKPHLQKTLQDDDTRRMEHFYEKACEKLGTAGLKKSQIEIKSTTWSYDISKAIIDEAKTRDHGTVVVGRRGGGKAFFAGHIAMRLLQKLSDRTLWVVP
jgi:nucleotide-binding universal stress UspA family protein